MIFVAALALFHVLCAAVTTRCIGAPRNRTEYLVITGLFAYITYYMVPVIVGWISGYMNTAVLATGAIAAASLAGASFYLTRNNKPGIVLPPLLRNRSSFECLLWLLIILLLTLITLTAFNLPARSYDAASYHMANTVRWHMTGRFIIDSFGDASFAPQRASAESAPNLKAILPFTILLFTGDIRGTAATQLPFLFLMVVTVRAIAIRIGARPWAASLSALATLAIPELLFQATETYADLVFLCGQVVITWSLLHLWREPFTWRSVIYPAIGFAILAGAKAAFLTTGAVLGVLYIILFLWRGIKETRWRAVPSAAAAAILILAVVSLSAAPWFLHSWEKYQNPVYPFKVTIGDRLLFDGVYDTDVNSTMLIQFTGVSGKEAYFNTLRENGRPAAFSNWAGGLGAGMFIVGIPSLLLFSIAMFFRRSHLPERLLFAIILGLLILTCANLGIARFTLFLPVFAFIAFAWLVSSFPLILRELSVLSIAAVMAYDLYMTTAAIQVRQLPPSLVAFNLLSGHSRAAQVATYPDQYTALDYWREEVSRPGLKLILPPADVSIWFAYQPAAPADMLRYRFPNNSADLDKWHTEILQAGGTHLYVQRDRRNYIDWIMQRSDLFELQIHRLDSHYGHVNGGYNLEPWPEDALFAIRQKDKS